MSDNHQWHWQRAGTSWKGVGIYHVTLIRPLAGSGQLQTMIHYVQMNKMAEEICSKNAEEIDIIA